MSRRPTYRRRVWVTLVVGVGIIVGTVGPAAAQPGIDTSPAAVQRFQAEWAYEVITPTDKASPPQKVLDAGVSVCRTMIADPSADPAAIAKATASTFGFSGSGGQAVTAAALRTLCPAQNRGYLTYWDQKVQGARDEMSRLTGILPTAYTTGQTMRATCDHFARTPLPPVQALEATLTTQGVWAQDENRRLVPFKPMVRAAVDANCGTVILNMWWYS